MSYSRLVLRNLLRHPLRTALTTLSIALSIFLVCAMLTLPGALSRILDRASSNVRLSVHHKAGLTYWLPAAFVTKIRTLPGVAGVNEFSWFGGIYDDPKNLFPNFAVRPEDVADVWPDYNIDPAALDRFRKIRNGALVGSQNMQKFGWKVGQDVTLRGTIFPVNLTFQIVGVIPPDHTNPQSFWFNRKYLEEAMEAVGGTFGQVGMIWVRVDRPDHVDQVMRTIDELFRNSESEVAVETEQAFVASFFSSLQGFMRIIIAVGVLVVIAVVLIAGNTSAMGVRERIPEIAILKSLGFRRRPILAALMAESILQASIGGLVGAGAAWGVLGWLHAAGRTGNMNALGPLGSFVMTPQVFVQGVATAVVVGVIAGIVPAWNGARMNVIQALRQIF